MTLKPTDASRTLRAAAARVIASHKPGCPDEEFWRKIAAWLGCVAIDEEYGEPETATRIRERTTALDIARIILATPDTHVPAGQQIGPDLEISSYQPVLLANEPLAVQNDAQMVQSLQNLSPHTPGGTP